MKIRKRLELNFGPEFQSTRNVMYVVAAREKRIWAENLCATIALKSKTRKKTRLITRNVKVYKAFIRKT